MRSVKVLLLLLFCAATVSPLPAQGPGSILQWHVLGNWAYGRTDGNDYLSGSRQGSYGRLDFWLNASATLNPRLRVVAQAGWEEEGEETRVLLDYAFMEWRPGASVQLRFGKSKLPLGLHVETYDVGTLRPFMDLPQAIYGGAGFYAEGYYGVGMTAPVVSIGPWRLTADLYAGGMDIIEDDRSLDYLRGTLDTLAADEPTTPVRDVVGGRLVLETPLPGLTAGASAFGGTSVHDDYHYATVAAQAEYRAGDWLFQAEFAAMRETDLETQRGAYVLAAWHVTDRWQVAGLYGGLASRLPGVDVSAAPSLLRHEEWGVALNYWIDPSFVLKASVLRVSGNRFASPDIADLAQAVQTGTLNPRTRLVQLGAAFAF